MFTPSGCALMVTTLTSSIPSAVTSRQPEPQGSGRVSATPVSCPWNANQFDAALMAGPLYHLTDPDDRSLALREAARVVRPGGLVAAVAFNRHANLLGATLANQLLDRRLIIDDIEAAGSSYRNDRVSPGQPADEVLMDALPGDYTGPRLVETHVLETDRAAHSETR